MQPGKGRPLNAAASKSYNVVGARAAQGARRRGYTATDCAATARRPSRTRVLPAQAAAWEQTAALSESQLRAIEALSQACSVRPLPAHVRSRTQSGPQQLPQPLQPTCRSLHSPRWQHSAHHARSLSKPMYRLDAQQRLSALPPRTFLQVVEDARPERREPHEPGTASKDGFVGSLEDAVLHNASQFHKWFSELEAACASETEEKYKRYADLLTSHVGSCEAILGRVSRTDIQIGGKCLGWSLAVAWVCTSSTVQDRAPTSKTSSRGQCVLPAAPCAGTPPACEDPRASTPLPDRRTPVWLTAAFTPCGPPKGRLHAGGL
jgi:hypothetical protein